MDAAAGETPAYRKAAEGKAPEQKAQLQNLRRWVERANTEPPDGINRGALTMNSKQVSKPREVTGPLRWLFWIGATFFFSIAMVGVVVPGLPTTPFLLLMCYFLIRVSPTLHAKAMRWPVVGEPLRVWHQHRGVRTRVKVTALTMVITLVGMTLVFSQLAWFAKLVLAAIALYGISVVLRLPTAVSDVENLCVAEYVRERQ